MKLMPLTSLSTRGGCARTRDKEQCNIAKRKENDIISTMNNPNLPRSHVLTLSSSALTSVDGLELLSGAAPF